ncbi:MAG: hypothetical protein HY548_07780 [Elusimicrobia bacterium]|nr:hypothetical protein [Elusimicrobiota bacterium]
MPEERMTETRYPGGVFTEPVFQKRISWGAVFAGVTVVLVTQFLLSLLGFGIGMSTINLATEAAPAQGVGIGAAIWWIVSAMIALYAGGWVSGHLAGVPRASDSALHGILTWGVSTLLAFFLVTTVVGNIIGGVAGTITRGVGMMAQQTAGQAREGGFDLGNLRQQARDLLRQGGQAGAQGGETEGVVNEILSRARGGLTQQERAEVIDILASQTGMNRQQAATTVNQVAEMAERAPQAAQAAAGAVSAASIWAFIGLLLGLGAAAWGGRAGMPKEAAVVSR